MEVLSKINAQLDEFKAKRATLVKELQTEFPKLITPLLSQSKKINSIGWTQYTPYFNDGDECVFGVNCSDLYINGERDGESERGFLKMHDYKIMVTEGDLKENKAVAKEAGYSWYVSKSIGEQGLTRNPEFDPAEHKIVEDIKAILDSVPEDFYKDLFGDHTVVTVHKDGRIETEEYDHD